MRANAGVTSDTRSKPARSGRAGRRAFGRAVLGARCGHRPSARRACRPPRLLRGALRRPCRVARRRRNRRPALSAD
eukprot:4925894-Lingulodinium_polyedra.AAC.1